MRSRWTLSAWCFVLLVTWRSLGGASGLQAQEPAARTKTDRLITQLVAAHNKERAKADLGPLTLEAHLVEAAQIHARDMAEHDVMTHEGTDGSNPADRVKKSGYHFLLTGENVAHGYRTVPEVMQGWMDSPPHKKNILGDFTEIGLAVAFTKEGKPYWSAEFGKPIPQLESVAASADLVRKINDERVLAKLPPMTADPRLSKAAQDQAAKLAKDNGEGKAKPSFDGVDTKVFRDLALSTAAGHPDAQAMVTNLMGNSELKTQILGKYTRIGTGYATSEDGVPYWCLILANPSRK